MLSPAILNKSRPRTVVSGMPCPLSVSLNAPEANFHLLKSSILRGQAHLRAAQPFLFEPWVHNSIIRSDSIEPSVYLPVSMFDSKPGNWAEYSKESASIIECWAQGSNKQ